jgi:hypothetical protein
MCQTNWQLYYYSINTFHLRYGWLYGDPPNNMLKLLMQYGAICPDNITKTRLYSNINSCVQSAWHTEYQILQHLQTAYRPSASWIQYYCLKLAWILRTIRGVTPSCNCHVQASRVRVRARVCERACASAYVVNLSLICGQILTNFDAWATYYYIHEPCTRLLERVCASARVVNFRRILSIW